MRPYIDTLAAAYAETGDFEKAIRFAEKAIHKARGDADAVKGAQERLALYQQHRPFRLAAAGERQSVRKRLDARKRVLLDGLAAVSHALPRQSREEGAVSGERTRLACWR